MLICYTNIQYDCTLLQFICTVKFVARMEPIVESSALRNCWVQLAILQLERKIAPQIFESVTACKTPPRPDTKKKKILRKSYPTTRPLAIRYPAASAIPSARCDFRTLPWEQHSLTLTSTPSGSTHN